MQEGPQSGKGREQQIRERILTGFLGRTCPGPQPRLRKGPLGGRMLSLRADSGPPPPAFHQPLFLAWLFIPSFIYHSQDSSLLSCFITRAFIMNDTCVTHTKFHQHIF